MARPFIASRERRELPHISIGDAFPDSPSWDSLPGTEAGVDEGDNIAMRYIEIDRGQGHTSELTPTHKPIHHCPQTYYSPFQTLPYYSPFQTLPHLWPGR